MQLEPHVAYLPAVLDTGAMVGGRREPERNFLYLLLIGVKVNKRFPTSTW